MTNNILNIITRINVIFLTILITTTQVFSEQFHGSSVKTIDNQIQILDSEITDISNKIRNLQSDSIRVITEYNTKKIQLENSLSDIESSLTLAKSNLQNFQMQLQDNRQDSISLAKSYMQKRENQSNDLASLEKETGVLSGNLKSMKSELGSLENISILTTDQKIITLKNDSTKTDSLINFHIRIVADHDSKLQQLKNDSITQHLKLQSLREQNRQKSSNYDSLYMHSRKSVDQISQQLSEVRNKYNASIVKTQDELKILTSQKIKLASSFTQQKIQFDKIKIEREKLNNSLKGLKKQYNRERAPYIRAIRESDSLLQLRVRQKKLWTVMNEKLRIDSMIMETRNELDKQIQLSAKGKRSAKKMVEQTENNLHSLLGKQNEYFGHPGVKHADSELAGFTLSQKRQHINKFISSINADLERLSDIKKKNELMLSDYDKQKPVKNNPSVQKYRNINNTYKNLGTHLSKLTHVKDSIDSAITIKQSALNSLKEECKRDIQAVESKLTAAVGQMNQLDSRLKQINTNSNTIEKKENDKLIQISTRIRSSLNERMRSEQEIIRLKSHKEQLKKDINDAFVDLDLKKQQAKRDIITLKEKIATAESQLSKLSESKVKLSGDNNNVYTDYRTKNTDLVNINRSINDSITLLKTKIQNLQSRSSNITLAITESQKHTVDKLDEIKKQLGVLYNQINQKQAAIKLLHKNRENAIATAKDENLKQVSMHSSNDKNTISNSMPPKVPDEPKSGSQQRKAENNRQNSPRHDNLNSVSIEPVPNGSIHIYDSLITVKENELARLKASREKIYMQGMEKQYKHDEKAQAVKTPNAGKAVSTGYRPNSDEVEATNTIIEQIYELLGKDKPRAARKLFSSQRRLLKKHAAPEAIKMLEAAISN